MNYVKVASSIQCIRYNCLSENLQNIFENLTMDSFLLASKYDKVIKFYNNDIIFDRKNTGMVSKIFQIIKKQMQDRVI